MESPDKLATALGWASLALGTPQTLAPGRFARAIGVRDDAHARSIIFGPCGLREHTAAAGLLLGGSRARPAFVWSRVAGDVLDVALLVRALRGRSERPERTAGALGAVAAVGALDVYTGVRLARARKQSEEARPVQIRHAITIRGARSDVEQRWREHNADNQSGWYSDATVLFTDAPGDRGTEIHVRLDGPGAVGKVVSKVTGNDDESSIKDELRRFKQVFETGEVVRSDGTPEGQTSARQLKQRSAQPLESAEAVR